MSVVREGAARGAAAPARLRVRPWRGGGGAAYVVPAEGGRLGLDAHEVVDCLRALARRGVAEAYTSALGRLDRQPFLDAGFHEVARLHLLVHPLDDASLDALARSVPRGRRRVGPTVRRARRRDRPGVLAADRAAFSRFWQLDEPGLTEALTATSRVRFRVAADASRIVGYAICGRAAQRGYVQRLAVRPEHQGSGTGRTLLLDCLRWLRRHGARDAIVNTQEENDRSLRLYQRSGFVLQPDGLAVLRADLTPSVPATDPAPPATGGEAT